VSKHSAIIPDELPTYLLDRRSYSNRAAKHDADLFHSELLLMGALDQKLIELFAQSSAPVCPGPRLVRIFWITAYSLGNG
jgi:hypothetical protein